MTSRTFRTELGRPRYCLPCTHSTPRRRGGWPSSSGTAAGVDQACGECRRQGDRLPQRGMSARPVGNDSGMPESVDRAGRSLLHYAALEGDVKAADELIAKGLAPGLADSAGFTPLPFAAQGQHALVARHLLAAGASVDPQIRFGGTPLAVALMNGRDGDGEVVRVLLAAGADPDVENFSGISPRSLAETITNFDLMRFFDPE
jgi:ankyrin repeat protein